METPVFATERQVYAKNELNKAVQMLKGENTIEDNRPNIDPVYKQARFQKKHKQY